MCESQIYVCVCVCVCFGVFVCMYVSVRVCIACVHAHATGCLRALIEINPRRVSENRSMNFRHSYS